MNEKHSTIGADGLMEFGNHLNRLHGMDYTFEMEDSSGRMGDCSLNDVIQRFQDYCGSDAERFRVRISYFDRQAGMMGYTDREFKRRTE